MTGKRLLVIDGGGARGILPATVLMYIEKVAGRPCHELFDLVCGNSTGGIIACGIARPMAATKIRALYSEQGPEIFRPRWPVYSRWLAAPKYDHRPLETILKEKLGNQPFRAAVTRCMVVSYDIRARRPVFFKSWKDRLAMWEVARATSAAPSYFRPHGALIDGAMVANNPALCAFAEARRLWPEHELTILSLGCGELTRPLRPAKMKGLLSWAPHLVSGFLDGQSDAVDYQLRTLVLGSSPRVDYHRFQTRLERASDDLDDVSPGQIAALIAEAEALIARRRDELEAVVAKLVVPIQSLDEAA